MIEHDDTRAALRSVCSSLTPLLAEVRAVLGGGAFDTTARLIVDALPFPVWVKDKDSVVLHVNDAYVEVFGIERRDMVGRDPVAVFGDVIAHRILEQDAAALAAPGLLAIQETATAPARTVYKLAIPAPCGAVLLWGAAILQDAAYCRQDHLALVAVQHIEAPTQLK